MKKKMVFLLLAVFLFSGCKEGGSNQETFKAGQGLPNTQQGQSLGTEESAGSKNDQDKQMEKIKNSADSIQSMSDSLKKLDEDETFFLQ